MLFGIDHLLENMCSNSLVLSLSLMILLVVLRMIYKGVTPFSSCVAGFMLAQIQTGNVTPEESGSSVPKRNSMS